MLVRLALIFGFLISCAVAQSRLTVEQLVTFIKSSVQLKHEDRRIAEYLKKIKLAARLDQRTIEELQGMGAGPQTLAALRLLVAESTGLPAPPPPAPPKVRPQGPPPPDSIEQKRILEAVREAALSYTKNLPNFICLQITRRYADNSGLEEYRLVDTIGERLSFAEQKESYEVVLVNNIPVTNVKHTELGGATSSGEFGTMLYEIFNKETAAQFNWERWATLRGKRMHVFSFRVSQGRSQYSILHAASRRTIVSGYHGLIFADRDTNTVMRIMMECDTLPIDFPIQQVSLDLNYDYAEIAERPYLLPLKAELRSREGKFMVKNEVEFRRFNKFGTESTIQFSADVDAPLPDDQTKEQPIPGPDVQTPVAPSPVR